MRKFLLAFLAVYASHANGQIFTQNFNSSSSRTAYIGSSANLLDGISNFGNAPSTITNNALRFSKNGASSAFFVRSTTLAAIAPDFVKMQFRLNVSVPTTLNDNQSYDATLYLGDGTDIGFSNPSQVTAPVTASIHTKVNIKLLISSATAKFSINSKEYTGEQTITLYINNTADTIPKIYTTPNGKKAMVANDKFDIWVGNEQVINEGDATTNGASINKFKFIYPSGAPNAIIDFDDIEITSNAAETPSKWLSVIKYQPPATEVYLGSPSILKLANGTILAAHDYFGPNRPRDTQGRSNYTSIYKSTDNGISWTLLSNISGMYWANLFEHKGAVYLLGTTAAMASIAIRKTTDGGATWTQPVSSSTGLLFNEGSSGTAPRYHGAPTPVLKSAGRLYRAFENVEDNTLAGYRGYKAFTVSIDENDNLLDATKWTKSNEITFNSAWDPAGSAGTTGWLEGNMVEGPDGKIWDILRVNSTPFFDRSGKIEITNVGQTASFSPTNFFTFPGGSCKFVIRKDTATNIYWAILNDNTNGVESNQRNVLALYASTDLNNWYLAKTLIEDDQNLSATKSIELTGFQYPDWQFDGNHIIYLSRTAYGDGVPRNHDSNFITFGRVENYVDYTPTALVSAIKANRSPLKTNKVNPPLNKTKLTAYRNIENGNAEVVFFWDQAKTTEGELMIRDISGKIVSQQKISFNNGYNRYSIPLQNKSSLHVTYLSIGTEKFTFKF